MKRSLHFGKADATGSFAADGGGTVAFDGSIEIPAGTLRVDVALDTPKASATDARSRGRVHERTDDALARHGLFADRCEETAEPLPDPTLFVTDVPRPIWDGHDDAVRCFAHCFEVTGRDYLRAPEPGSGFTRNFVYTPFGSRVFLWGTSFISMYGRYASHLFPFAGMLDNFYAAQRRAPAPGDIRLLFAPGADGASAVAVRYTFSDPAVPEEARHSFTSPTGTALVDRVETVGVKANVTKRKDGYEFTADIPWDVLGEKGMPAHGETRRIDAGVLFGDADGGATVRRAYLFDGQSQVVSDLPSEVRVCPANWGEVQF